MEEGEEVPSKVPDSMAALDLNEKPSKPSPRIPFELILYTSTILHAQKADHALAKLSASCKVLNHKIMPQLYGTVHFHSTASLKAFLGFYSRGGVFLRGETEDVVGAKHKGMYGRRNGYLTGLIKHIDLKIDYYDYEDTDHWATAAEKMLDLDSSKPVAFIETMYVEGTGVCPCLAVSKKRTTPRTNSLRDQVYFTFQATSVCCACRESKEDHNRWPDARTSHQGYWAQAMVPMKTRDDGEPGKFGVVDIWDEKSMEYSCLHLNHPMNLASPPREDKADRPLVCITSAPASDTRPTRYETSVHVLRLTQKYRLVRLLVQKVQPFSDGQGYRQWYKEKGEWLKSNPGAWEDWAIDKRRRFNESLGVGDEDPNKLSSSPAGITHSADGVVFTRSGSAGAMALL